MEVPIQEMLMDSNECRVLKIQKTKFADTKSKKVKQFDGFCQRDSYFVVPVIDKLKRDKLQLKRQMNLHRQGEEVFTRYRVVNAGKDLNDPKKIYYVSPV